MATITQLLQDTVKLINEITDENEISKRLQSVITLNSNAKASTIERYMTFMNDFIFSKLSTEHPLEDLRQLVPMIEKVVVLVSDDGLSLEEALQMVQTAHVVVETVAEEIKKPASFACVLSVGKRIVPLISRLLHASKCMSPSAVAVAAPACEAIAARAVSACEATAAIVVAAESALKAAPEEHVPTEQSQSLPESAPAPLSPVEREAEPIPPASDNTDQKEETAN